MVGGGVMVGGMGMKRLLCKDKEGTGSKKMIKFSKRIYR
jgi:hypothetical protein